MYVIKSTWTAEFHSIWCSSHLVDQWFSDASNEELPTNLVSILCYSINLKLDVQHIRSSILATVYTDSLSVWWPVLPYIHHRSWAWAGDGNPQHNSRICDAGWLSKHLSMCTYELADWLWANVRPVIPLQHAYTTSQFNLIYTLVVKQINSGAESIRNGWPLSPCEVMLWSDSPAIQFEISNFD